MKAQESEQAVRAKESHKAIGLLAKNPKVFVRVARAFDEEDSETFRAQLRAAGLWRYCRVICYWFCTWRCAWRCHLVCVPVPIPEPGFPWPPRGPGDPYYGDLLKFARLVAQINGSKAVMSRLQKAAAGDNLKSYRAMVQKLAEPLPTAYRALFCRWICQPYCYQYWQRTCRFICT